MEERVWMKIFKFEVLKIVQYYERVKEYYKHHKGDSNLEVF